MIGIRRLMDLIVAYFPTYSEKGYILRKLQMENRLNS